MNLNDFAEYVHNRHNPDPLYRGFFWDNLEEACMGLASEAGEIMQCQRKLKYERKPIKPGEYVMEASDVLHYLVLFCKKSGVSLEDLAAVNHLKTKAIDAGVRGDFELILRMWDPDKEKLTDELDRIERVILYQPEEGEDDEPMS